MNLRRAEIEQIVKLPAFIRARNFYEFVEFYFYIVMFA